MAMTTNFRHAYLCMNICVRMCVRMIHVCVCVCILLRGMGVTILLDDKLQTTEARRESANITSFELMP